MLSGFPSVAQQIESDRVMIQNICRCLLMQFKMSMVKYSEGNYSFKPFLAPHTWWGSSGTQAAAGMWLGSPWCPFTASFPPALLLLHINR